jgi:hypothetical protein
MKGKAAIRASEQGIERQLKAMTRRAKNVRGFLNRQVYPYYKNLQADRWKTEGASQNFKWKPLNKDYAIKKKKLYAAFPGSGANMLVGTGKLFNSVVGKGPGKGKIVIERRLRVYTTVPYAPFVDEKRTFTKWNRSTSLKIGLMLKRYLKGYAD